MSLAIRSAKKSESPLLGRLLQDYLREFAEFETVEQDEDGRYVYPYFTHYWDDPNRYPFLFWQADQPVGFALVRYDVDPGSGGQLIELAEFYIVPAARRAGLGRTAATALWDLFPGRWCVRVLRSNKNALPFWRRVIGQYSETNFQEHSPEGFAGGFFTFTFNSAADLEPPDDVAPDFID